MKSVRLITDGSCLGNPGPGGWAYILRYGDQEREAYGCEKHTTNNRMELSAAIAGLKALKERCKVEIVTDSEYVKNGITAWIHGWKRKGWMTAAKKPVVNRDLWEELDRLVGTHSVRVGVDERARVARGDNNRCDELAQRAAREQRSSE